MCGHTVSEVVESRNPGFQPGDIVAGYDGWQEYAASNGKDLRKLDPSGLPISTALGVLGMPGMTGVRRSARHRPAEAGRDRRRVGGVRRGRIDRRSAREDQGVPRGRHRRVARRNAATSSTSSASTPASTTRPTTSCRRLRAACPNGIDIYFENVGGEVFAAVLRVLNRGARIPLCGMISEYNATRNPGGPNLRPLLVQPRDDQGLHRQRPRRSLPGVPQGVTPLVRDGRIKYREDIVDGLEAAPSALDRPVRGTQFRQDARPGVAGPDLRPLGDDATERRNCAV